MLIFRWLILMLLLGAIASFMLYIGTAQACFKRYGLTLLRWTVVVIVGFYAVLILERIA